MVWTRQPRHNGSEHCPSELEILETKPVVQKTGLGGVSGSVMVVQTVRGHAGDTTLTFNTSAARECENDNDNNRCDDYDNYKVPHRCHQPHDASVSEDRQTMPSSTTDRPPGMMRQDGWSIDKMSCSPAIQKSMVAQGALVVAKRVKAMAVWQSESDAPVSARSGGGGLPRCCPNGVWKDASVANGQHEANQSIPYHTGVADEQYQQSSMTAAYQPAATGGQQQGLPPSNVRNLIEMAFPGAAGRCGNGQQRQHPVRHTPGTGRNSLQQA